MRVTGTCGSSLVGYVPRLPAGLHAHASRLHRPFQKPLSGSAARHLQATLNASVCTSYTLRLHLFNTLLPAVSGLGL